MIHEISAGLDYLVTLLHPSIDCKAFKQQAQASLLTRYNSTWFTDDPNRASACRVIHWHGHGGGEGQDESIFRACSDNIISKEQEIDFFASPYTLWIDPGCVSIRLGHGPGVYLSPASSLNIRIIYGQPSLEKLMPLMPPTVNLVPSTPALSKAETPPTWSSATSISLQSKSIPQGMPPFHNRSFSACSNSSTFTATRSASNGSSSYLSSADENEQCPSLTNTSARDSDSEISIEDLIDNGCYMNFDIIDDEEEEDASYGDETIGNQNLNEEEGDVTVGPSNETVPKAPGSIVNYDGGNVGVLGGGIRLGGVSKPQTLNTVKPLMHTKADVAVLGTSVWSQKQALPTYNSDASLGFSIASTSPFAVMDGTKRIRSRGRRSRGRGAGRAARRQAAALQAMSCASGIEGSTASSLAFSDRLDDSGEDENIMALVRQRAEQVSREVVRRQRESDNLRMLPKLPQSYSQYTYNTSNTPLLTAPQKYLYGMSQMPIARHQESGYTI